MLFNACLGYFVSNCIKNHTHTSAINKLLLHSFQKYFSSSFCASKLYKPTVFKYRICCYIKKTLFLRTLPMLLLLTYHVSFDNFSTDVFVCLANFWSLTHFHYLEKNLSEVSCCEKTFDAPDGNSLKFLLKVTNDVRRERERRNSYYITANLAPYGIYHFLLFKNIVSNVSNIKYLKQSNILKYF